MNQWEEDWDDSEKSDDFTRQLRAELEKFAARWHALKPQDVTSWEAEDVQKVFDSLTEWRNQV